MSASIQHGIKKLNTLTTFKEIVNRANL